MGNLQVKILLIILLFLFAPIIFALNNSFKHTEKIVIENTSALIMDNSEQVGGKIENICLNMIALSNIILTDNTILDNLSSGPDDEFPGNDDEFHRDNFQMKDPSSYTNEDSSTISKVENQINYINKGIFFNNNVYITIIGADGNLYYSSDNYEDGVILKYEQLSQFLGQDWFRTLKSGSIRAVWNSPYRYGIEGLNGDRYISIIKSIRNKYSPENVAGILMINFSEKGLTDIIDHSDNGYFALINEPGRIIFSSEKSVEDKILANEDILSKNLYYGKGSFVTPIDGEKYIVSFNSIERFGMCAISLVPYKDVIKDIAALKFKINSANILIFAIFLVLGTCLILNTISPIKKLLRRMKKMKVGAYSVGIKENENIDDVNGLVHSFDNMLNRVEELVDIVVREEKLKDDLRYKALSAQINPHFLFNTLSTIKWSAKLSGADNVSRMISALGKLLEMSINKGEEQIAFREELELAECYIYIQNARYNDKFELRVHIKDEKIYSYKVPKFILQPIVENSIIHGFEDKSGDCRIEINAYAAEGGLVIDVADNGAGMDKDVVEQLFYKNENTAQKFSGIGLKNVQERIQLKYGRNYGLSITSEVGKGTAVSVSIPKIEEIQDGVV